MNDAEAERLKRIGEVLARHGAAALGSLTAAQKAREWLDGGFDDEEEVAAWLGARCFDAARAQALERAGFTPEQASLRTREGRRDYEDTVAFKLAAGDLTPEEARRIVTSEFWNS